MVNNKKNEDRRFYVYEHIRKDNNTCFYVGKGTGDRAYNLDRGNFHNGVCKEYGCRVKIIKDGLTEKEAFALERERIEDYVITFGYGIPIDGYRDYSNNYLTNFTWGGEGISGLNPYANKTPEEMEKIRRKNSEAHKGKKTSDETKRKISESEKGKKISDETKRKMSEAKEGEKHNFYGKHHSDETKRKMSEKKKCENNPMAKKVICITTGKIFDCIKYASDHYKVATSGIVHCCRGKYQHAGELNGVRLQWKYLKDYNNEFKGILINPIINK